MGIHEGLPMTRPTRLEPLADLPDPRINRTKKHRLDDIHMIPLIGVRGGAATFDCIREFARYREAWFRTFLALPNRIPNHNTIYRVLCSVYPQVLAQSFGQWLCSFVRRRMALPTTIHSHPAER